VSQIVRGRYEVVARLGAGAHGTVFEVHDLLLDVPVALKALWPDENNRDALVASLRGEFGVLASLHHPLLCRVFDFGRLPAGVLQSLVPGLFLTRQLIDGVDLEAAAVQAERDLGQMCRTMAQAARGLSALHRAGLRHGDFKPSNAIVDRRGAVRLIDFGLTVAEATVKAAGTLAYMAPEVLARRATDRRADLYALGVSLFQLYAGELPSGGRVGAALMSWHLEGARPRLSAMVKGVPPTLDRLVTQLLSADPDERVPTAAEAATALEQICQKLGVAPEPRSAVGVPVARSNQVGSLERAYNARIETGTQPALIELVGEAGAGKTAALTEVSWRLQLAGAEVLRANPRGRGRPLGVIGSALQQLAALAQTPPPAHDEASGRRQGQYFAALARWLTELSARFPVVIVVDDLDAADRVSRELAAYLASALDADARVLIIASRQPRAGEQPGHGGAGAPAQVWLEPLTGAEVARLLERAAGRADPALAARIHRTTGGNPLHTAHVLRYLAERDFPPAHSLEALRLPDQLHQTAVELLAHLDELSRLIYQALSVLDRPVSVEVLRAVVVRVRGPVGVDAFDAAVDAACADGVVVGNPLDWRIRRPSLARAVYQLLGDGERAGLHRAALAVLIDGGADRAEPEVVLHAVRGGDVSVARAQRLATVRRLWRAGDQSAALMLGAEVFDLLADAGVDVDIELRSAVGELGRLAGDLPLVERVVEPLLAHADDTIRDRAIYMLGCAYEEAGRPERAIPLFDTVLDERPVSVHAPLIARALSRLHIKRGRNAEALAVVERALSRELSADQARHLDVACSFATGALGRNDAAEAELEILARAALDHGDHGLAATAYNYAALLAFRRGDYPHAKHCYAAALEPARQDGDAVRVGTVRMNLAAVAFHLGDYADCFREHTAALSLLRAIGAATSATISRRNLGHLLCELGEYERARVELSAARDSAETLGLELHVAGCEALLGIVDCRAGDWQRGVDQLEAAVARFAELEAEAHVSETLLDIAEVCVAATAPEAAAIGRDALARAVALAATDAKLDRRARCLAYRAAFAADTEAPELVAALGEPLAQLRGQAKRHTLWGLHYAAARAAAAADAAEVAQKHRDAALAILDSIASDLSDAQRAAFWHDPRRRWLRSTGQPSASSDTALATQSDVTDHRLLRLLAIYRQMSSERDYARLLDMVMQSAVELSGTERGFLLLAQPGDEGAPTLRTAVSYNLSVAAVRALAQADTDPLSTPTTDAGYSRTIAERVFETGERVVSDNPRFDPRFDQAQSVHALQLQSVVCLPVHCRGAVVGVLYLEARYRRVEFSAADVQLLTAFGDQVAILLGNAKLLDENTARAAELGHAQAQIEELLAERTALLDTRTEQLARTRRELASMRRRFLGDRGAFGLVGRAPAMERVFELIDRLAGTDVPVLVVGESGTGKELVARALHEHGGRGDRDLVSVNCAALPETLLAGELFGHVRGAFTGADRDRRGLFEVASGGTLFLDEVGDMPSRMQSQLLRALAEGVIRRVGASGDIAVDVRIIAATNRDLPALVEAGCFREDLYYRLNVVTLPIPPLRERSADIALLAEHFLAAISARTGVPRKQLSKSALRKLMDYDWPGNVRQLEHALTNAAVMADADELSVDDFELFGAAARPDAIALSPDERKQRERARIVEALEACGWNKSKAARMLQIPRRTFYRRLADYEIQ